MRRCCRRRLVPSRIFGWIHGGGMFNSLVFKRPVPALTLRSSNVTGNAITASAGVVARGPPHEVSHAGGP
jgi:hypothetical protein